MTKGWLNDDFDVPGNITAAQVNADNVRLDGDIISYAGTAVFTLDSSGAFTASTQPLFIAQAATQSNVTGDGTVYTAVFSSEIKDQNSDFDATSTYTNPIAGSVQLNSSLLLTNVTDTTRFDNIIVTSNRSYTKQIGGTALADANSVVTLSMSQLCDMDAGDTATITIKGSNGTKIVDVNSNSFFSGWLVA